MEEDLAARLLADAGLAALVGNRITWIDRPRGDALPAVTLQVISPGRDYTFAGADHTANPRVQADCWGATYPAAKLVYRALLPAIEPPATQGGTRFTAAFMESASDLPPEDLLGGGKAYRVTADFIIWHNPA